MGLEPHLEQSETGAATAPEPASMFAGRALGSPLRLTLTRSDAATAEAAWSAVVDEFAAVDEALSNYRQDSAVSALNRRAGAGLAPVDHRLGRALGMADRAWRVTGGRFDPRVALALQVLGRVGTVPVSIGSQVAGTTGRWLQRDPRARTASTSDPIDLGGIGKGLALRWAWDRLTRILRDPDAGGLLECGGDLIGRGPGPNGAEWLIAVEDPRADVPTDQAMVSPDRSGGVAPLAVVALRRGALCTSSIRLSRWIGPAGDLVHHLIDPRTGRPGGDGLLAVTVAWPDPAWAEIRTKELFLAGSERIAAIARGRDLAAWWVTSDGALEMTPRARQTTRWP